MKRVTLDDLADHLGLSKFSVSRALSGKPGVSDQTRQRVFAAARTLGYAHPALDLPESRRGCKIALIIPRIDAVTSAYWMQTLAGLEQEAERIGYDVTTHLVGENPDSPISIADYRGLIIAGRRSRGLTEAYLAADLPKTLIGHPLPGEQLDCVRSESWSSGYLIGEHLFALGHRSVAYLSDAPDDVARLERFRGLTDAMTRPGEPVQVESHAFDPNGDAQQALASLLRSATPPTAIFGATDMVAMTIAWALKELGLDIPGHVSVAGCNNSEMARQIGLPLTTIHYHMRAIGAAAIRMLDWRLERAGPDEPGRQLLLRPELLVRESTGKANEGALRKALRQPGRKARIGKALESA